MTRVGLIFGSRSVEHEISITTAGKAYDALRQLHGEYETVPIYLTKAGAWLTGSGVERLLIDRGGGSRVPGTRPPQGAPGELQGAAPSAGAG